MLTNQHQQQPPGGLLLWVQALVVSSGRRVSQWWMGCLRHAQQQQRGGLWRWWCALETMSVVVEGDMCDMRTKDGGVCLSAAMLDNTVNTTPPTTVYTLDMYSNDDVDVVSSRCIPPAVTLLTPPRAT